MGICTHFSKLLELYTVIWQVVLNVNDDLKSVCLKSNNSSAFSTCLAYKHSLTFAIISILSIWRYNFSEDLQYDLVLAGKLNFLGHFMTRCFLAFHESTLEQLLECKRNARHSNSRAEIFKGISDFDDLH